MAELGGKLIYCWLQPNLKWAMFSLVQPCWWLCSKHVYTFIVDMSLARSLVKHAMTSRQTKQYDMLNLLAEFCWTNMVSRQSKFAQYVIRKVWSMNRGCNFAYRMVYVVWPGLHYEWINCQVAHQDSLCISIIEDYCKIFGYFQVDSYKHVWCAWGWQKVYEQISCVHAYLTSG